LRRGEGDCAQPSAHEAKDEHLARSVAVGQKTGSDADKGPTRPGHTDQSIGMVKCNPPFFDEIERKDGKDAVTRCANEHPKATHGPE